MWLSPERPVGGAPERLGARLEVAIDYGRLARQTLPDGRLD